MQVNQRKASVGGKQSVGKEECARSVRKQAHGKLTGPLDPFVG